MEHGGRVFTLGERLDRLRADHPDAVIQTDLVEHDATRGVSIVKATVTAGRAVATAYASWSRDRTAAYVDHAERAALSRALQRLGYGRVDVRPETPASRRRIASRPAYRSAARFSENFDEQGVVDEDEAADAEPDEISSRATAKQLRQLTQYGAAASSLAQGRYGRELEDLEISEAEELLRELERP